MLTLSALLTLRAVAQPAVRLPDGCGSAVEFVQGVERLVGADALADHVVKISISDPNDRGVHVLTVEADGVRRWLEHPDCRTLLRSAVVIVAASARPSSETRSSSALHEAEGGVSLPPRRAVEEPSFAEPAAGGPRNSRGRSPESVPRWNASLGVAAGAAYGVVPGIGNQWEARGALYRDRWGGSVAVRHVLKRHTSQEGRGAEVFAVGARVAALYRATKGLGVAAGIEIDLLRGEGVEGVPRAHSASLGSAATFGELAVIPWQVGHMRLELALQGRIALLRPRFVVVGYGDVYRVPAAGVGGLIRGVWLFP